MAPASASIPTLELAGPAGGRVVVAPRSPDDRVGELADALGVDPARELELDGRPVTRHETIGRAGVVRGSTLAPAGSPGSRRAATAGDGVVLAVCDAGPAAGGTVALAPGRHVIGRSPRAAVRIGDHRLEPHHVVVDVGLDGSVTVVQLTGRVPCRIDGEPVGGPTTWPVGSHLTLGASRIRIVPADRAATAGAVVAPLPGDPWRRALRRTPRVVPRWDPEPIPVPDPSAIPSPISATSVVAALLTAAGAIVVAAVMGSALFLVFAGVGLAASLALWAMSVLSGRRAGRRHRAGRERDLAAFAAAAAAQREARRRHHDATTPEVAAAVLAATTLREDVWCRRSGHGDVHRATIGWGTVDWSVVLEGRGQDPRDPALAAVVAAAGSFEHTTVPVDLGPGAAVAITGTDAAAVARSLVVQLATWTGPADVQLVVITGDPAAWDWCRWLPHAASVDGPRVVSADAGDRISAALGSLEDGSGRHVVVITDRAEGLSQRTGTLRRFLGGASDAAVVAVVGVDGSPPAMCRSVLEIGSLGMARWWADAAVDGHPVSVHVAGVTVATATSVARSLARLHDPEEAGGGAEGLPPAVGIGALFERYGRGPIDDPIAIAATWRGAGSDPAPVAALGVTADGVVEVDLARDGPHALVAGTTGSGKSELLRTLVASLAARCSPEHLTFVLVDYKGGATFDACAELPHTVGLVTDLDDHLAARALASLEAEVRRRERVLRESGAVDLGEHRTRGGSPLARLVVVIDEFATLAAELPDFLGALVGIAQRGRSLGVHLVLATQRPAGVVSDDIRANTDLRLALRLHDVADARDVVGDDRPASFPRGMPGRALLRLGADEHVVFQAARSSGAAVAGHEDRLHVVAGAAASDDDAAGDAELTVLVRTIRNAAALSDVAGPRPPWLPPLPDRIDPAAVAVVAPDGGAVGVLDDPAAQCRRPMRWSPADGNLAIVGAVGSGTTTALRSLLVAAMTASAPADRHVYVVDAGGEERLDTLSPWPHCGGVVRPHERERLSRLLRRLADEIDARRSAAGRAAHPSIVLAVDALPGLRTVLDDPLDHDDLDLLGRIATEGAAVGIVTVFTAERPAAVPAALLATCAHRWVGRLDDPAEATTCGLPPAQVPRAGPGRFVVATTRLLGQIADLGAPRPGAGPGGPAPIGVLPASVVAPPAGSAGFGGDARLVVGVDFESLADGVLHVPDGEHVLVAGPARSGRTSTLAAFAASWRAAHPGGVVRVVAPRPGGPWAGAEVVGLQAALDEIAAVAAGGPTLLVVDDAERVDDPRLGPLLAERRPGLLAVVAGRPDALRSLYGHWTTVVRRSRIGILLTACVDVDGDLLGELLPRRPPIPSRPGLAWLVDATGRRLAQISRP